ncbi:hypothetical protein OROMI_011299 [Orobanche minor]
MQRNTCSRSTRTWAESKAANQHRVNLTGLPGFRLHNRSGSQMAQAADASLESAADRNFDGQVVFNWRTHLGLMGHFYGSILLTLADKNQLDLLLLRRLHTTPSIDFSASLTSHNGKQSIDFSAWPRLRTTAVVVNIWNLKIYICAITVPTYEALKSVCAFGSASPFVSCLSSFTRKNGKETINSSSIRFVTVGECGVVRIWNSDGAALLFEQKSSDLAVSSKKEEVKRGFTSAMMLPLGQGLLCATVDQQFLIYGVNRVQILFNMTSESAPTFYKSNRRPLGLLTLPISLSLSRTHKISPIVFPFRIFTRRDSLRISQLLEENLLAGSSISRLIHHTYIEAHCYSTLVRRSTASPSVIVIGAGFAGITAARALHDASFQVTVLESRDRIGGRVHTDYSFGFPVDLCASWHPELGLRRNLNQANF